MEVYNGGDEDSPMLGKFCGKIAPSPIISSGSQLLIKFVSDYETHGAGFSVRYEVFKTGVCPDCASRDVAACIKQQHRIKKKKQPEVEQKPSRCCFLHARLNVMNRLVENSQFKFN